MTFISNDINLQTTLTFEQFLVKNNHVVKLCELGNYSFDLHLDPMTLVFKLDLDIVKLYVCTENKVLDFSASKVIPG